jgi:hypothetical protein
MDASGATDESVILRTAKSCGPDASMVGVKLADLSAGDGDNKARSPGRVRGRPLKPLRAGMPGDPGATVVTNACVLLLYTRGRGCNGHPAFPAPLGVALTPFVGRKNTGTTRALRAAGRRSCIRAIRVIARSEATKQSILSSPLHGLPRFARNDGQVSELLRLLSALASRRHAMTEAALFPS